MSLILKKQIRGYYSAEQYSFNTGTCVQEEKSRSKHAQRTLVWQLLISKKFESSIEYFLKIVVNPLRVK